MNISNLFKKLVSLIVAFLISLGVISAPSVPEGGIKADATILFSDSDPGCAGGKISVTSNFDGVYEVYWGNADGEKLSTLSPSGKNVEYSYFANVSVEKGNGSATLSEFLAIPENAETTLLYYKDELLDTDTLPSEKVNTGSEKLYSFGALSDVHFNRYSDKSDDDAKEAFPNSLNFLKDMGVSFVGVCGDLSSRGESSAYEKFNGYASQYDFPIFSCKGNHDCYEKFDYNAWKENINPGVYTDVKRDGVLDVADNGYDFVYSGEETKGDIFVFFSQISSTYAPFVKLVTDEQLDWLAGVFEKYKNERVYLFFHTFLNAPSGVGALGEGNIVNDYGFSYPLPYFKGNSDEVRFRELLTEYKNVTFFNGHSHLSYDMQSYNPRLNITDYDGTTATMVHVSSVSAPRTASIKSPTLKSNPGTMSEGLYVTVYPDYIITTACDFIGGRFLAYATYRVDKK